MVVLRLEAKRQSELNPKKTVEQFWKENTNELPARFQLLDKEKPSILLDNASNLMHSKTSSWYSLTPLSTPT